MPLLPFFLYLSQSAVEVENHWKFVILKKCYQCLGQCIHKIDELHVQNRTCIGDLRIFGFQVVMLVRMTRSILRLFQIVIFLIIRTLKVLSMRAVVQPCAYTSNFFCVCELLWQLLERLPHCSTSTVTMTRKFYEDGPRKQTAGVCRTCRLAMWRTPTVLVLCLSIYNILRTPSL